LGGPGSDQVYGGTERDFVIGGPSGSYPQAPQELDSSDDYLYGGPGDDTFWPGWVSGGVDHLYGEDGNDSFHANQEEYDFRLTAIKEIVDCGPGDDTVYYDPGVDVVMANCEHLKDNYGNTIGH
jgi:Ca2+-binding RTX toxin-like protein